MRRLGTRGGAEVLQPGDALAGYRIEGPAGDQHGAGRVYLARPPEDGRLAELAPWLPIALKVLSPRSARQRAFERRFVDAARLQARISHPAVVAIHEVGSSPVPYLAMALVQGPSLAELLAERRLNDDEALALARRVAAGLEAGREQGIAFKRLGPSGVLVPSGDPTQAVLGDFGAGRRADVEADVASNVCALGAILFACLTGERPGGRGLRELRPDLRPELDQALARALNEDPAQRQGSAAELIEAVDGATTPRRTGRGVGRRPAQAGRRLTMATPALALVLVGAAALGAIVAPGDEDRIARASSLSSGAVNLRYPADWTRAREAVDPGGVELTDAVAIAPRGDSGERALVAGHLGPGALPGGRREAVELDALQAYRYTGLPAGSREANLYVVPTKTAAVAVACVAPAGSARFMANCERVASTLTLDGESAVGLAPSPRYAASLRRLVGRLDRARRSGRRALGQARTHRGQAAVAERISRAYRRAGRTAARLRPPPGVRAAHAEIVRALAEAARGYRSMAAAGRSSSSGAWDAASRAAVAGEQTLQQGIRSLAELGYRPRA